MTVTMLLLGIMLVSITSYTSAATAARHGDGGSNPAEHLSLGYSSTQYDHNGSASGSVSQGQSRTRQTRINTVPTRCLPRADVSDDYSINCTRHVR